MSALPSLSFGSLLRRHRHAAGFTQEELAERSGVSSRAVIALEGGKRRRPYRHTIQLLASALQLSARDVEMLEYTAGYTRSLRMAVANEASVHAAPLVGRSPELAAVQRYLDNPGPPVLVFAGEPGIGKSRLLEEAARRARARGFTVLQGGAHRRSGQEPYAPLLDTLSGSLTSFSPPQLRAALSGCGWLARLLPELVEIVSIPLPFGTLPAEQERRLVFGAVARYLANIAGAAGTLLVLDDLQWASLDGLDLLTFLLRSSTNEPIRVVGAYRDTEVGRDHPLSATLADLAEHNKAEQLTVEPLAAQQVTELLDVLLTGHGGTAQDGAVRQEIVRRAGGLPFFLVSCVQGLALAPAGRQNRSAVPWTVAHSVRQRIAALPDGTQQVLHAAAVTGHAVERRVLIGMDLAPEGEVLAGLDAACRARLLVLEGEREYRFAHDVIREVIEADLGSGQRTLLHRCIGEALERLPERSRRAAELAWHFLEADVPQRALHYSLLAGDEAVGVFAHAEAELHYRTAVEAAREVGDVVQEAEGLEKLGRVLWTVGRYDEASNALESAAAIQQRVGNLEAEGEIASALGWVLSQQGRPEEGVERLQSVAARLEAEDPSPALVAVYETLIHLFNRQGRDRDAAHVAQRASEVGRTLGDERGRARGEVSRGIALMHQDRWDDALRVFEDAMPAAGETGESNVLALALIHAAWIRQARGELDLSRRHYERLIDLRKRTSSADYVANARVLLGDLLFLQGDWRGARSEYERAADLTSTLASHQAGWARQSFARLCLCEGKWQDAAGYLEECVSIVERTGDQGSVPEVQALLAKHDLLQGRAEAAVARLEPLRDHFDLDHDELLVLAEGYVEIGNTVRADEVVTQGVERAVLQHNRLVLADWRRLQGTLMADQGRWEEAERALVDAATLAAAMPYPLASARALDAWGRMGIQQGALEEARERLGEALAIFQRLGALPYIERTEQALAELK